MSFLGGLAKSLKKLKFFCFDVADMIWIHVHVSDTRKQTDLCCVLFVHLPKNSFDPFY